MHSTTKNPHQRAEARYWLSDLIWLTCLIGIFYALWIGSYPLFTPDEGRYSEVAREMVVSGDYITPRLNGVAFLDKPALYYWLQASAIKWFGLQEWALRFWPALLGILSVLVTYCTSRIIFNRRTGLLSALILASSPLYYGAAHYANLDLEVASLVANSLLCFIAAMTGRAHQLKSILLYAAYIFAGLAALTKGLIGIAFPMMIIGSWILLLNRWRTLTSMHLLSGLLIFFAMTIPWYVLVQRENPEFLHFFFYTQQVSRFLTKQVFNSRVAFWFYAPVVLAGFFPWTVFLCQALTNSIKRVWQDKQAHAAELFLLLWFGLIFIFFSIPQSKTVGYILPIFPALAVLTGRYIDASWGHVRAWRSARYSFAIVALGLGAVTAWVSFRPLAIDISQPFMPYLQWMSIVILVAALVLLSLPRRQSLWVMTSTLFATISVLLLIFINSAQAINEKTVKPLIQDFTQLIKPQDEVIAYYKYYQDLPLYLQRRISIVADWQASDIAENDNWVREMWYGMVFQDTTAWLINDAEFWRRWQSPKRVFVVTDEDYAATLARKGRIYALKHYHDMVLLSNQPI